MPRFTIVLNRALAPITGAGLRSSLISSAQNPMTLFFTEDLSFTFPVEPKISIEQSKNVITKKALLGDGEIQQIISNNSAIFEVESCLVTPAFSSNPLLTNSKNAQIGTLRLLGRYDPDLEIPVEEIEKLIAIFNLNKAVQILCPLTERYGIRTAVPLSFRAPTHSNLRFRPITMRFRVDEQIVLPRN